MAQYGSIAGATNVDRGRAWDLAGFLVFSHGWTWIFWLLASVWGTTIWAPPGVYFFYVGGAGVALGALVMSWVTGGVDGMKEVGWRIIDMRRISGAWWAVILLMFPALTLAAAAIAFRLGHVTAPFDLDHARNLLVHPLQLLPFLGLILIIGPLPEEIGWRGYLLDRLQLWLPATFAFVTRWNALAASLLLAVIWWLWHLPLALLPGYYDAFGHAPPSLLGFLYGLIPAAILYTWVYNNTRRSILAVILFHFVQNLTGEFLGLTPEVRQIQLVLLVVAAVVVTLWWGPETFTAARIIGAKGKDVYMVASGETPTIFTRVMWLAVALAGLTALIYISIGLEWLGVGDLQPDESSPVIIYVAAGAYVLGGLLILLRRRWLWIVGAIINALVLLAFFSAYLQRPSVLFSPGGVISKIVQIALEVVLLYLIVVGWRKLSQDRRATAQELAV